MWKTNRHIGWVWKWLEKFAKPSMSSLTKCSVKELYPRYKQIILGTECPRHCGGEVSINMLEREKALYLQWRRERWRNVFWIGKEDLGEKVHGKLWNEMKTFTHKWKCEKFQWSGLHSVYVDGRQGCPFTGVTVTLQTTLFWDRSGVLSCIACERRSFLWWCCWYLCWLYTFMLITKQSPRC